MTRPSEPLLRWLRSQIDAKRENTASLATRIGRPRTELRRILTGVDPLTVDDLVRITEAMGLTVADLGASAVADGPRAVEEVEELDDSAHWQNQPRTLFRIGFDHGIDFLFLCAADELDGWGGPEAVRTAHRGKELAIQVDSQYHRFMNPRLEDEVIRLRLSFDTLYDCSFPWTSIRRVVFTPLAPAPPQATPEPEPPPKGRPTLRLVK